MPPGLGKGLRHTFRASGLPREAFWDFSKLETSSALSHPGDRRPQNTARCPQFPATISGREGPAQTPSDVFKSKACCWKHSFHQYPQQPPSLSLPPSPSGVSSLVTENFDKTPRYMLSRLTHLHSPNVTSSRDLHQPGG